MTNPFFEPSTLPYGMPPFAEITDEHYRPAFEKGMEEQLEEIANDHARRRDMPTFENTMIPLEQQRPAARRASPTCSSTRPRPTRNDFTNELEEEIAPAARRAPDAIKLDSQLYWRIKTLLRPARRARPRRRVALPRRALLHRVHGRRRRSRRDREGEAARLQPAALDAHDAVREEPARRHQRPRRRDRRCRRARRPRARRDLGRRRGREGARSRRQVPRDARAADRASVARLASPTATCASGSWRRRAPAAAAATSATTASSCSRSPACAPSGRSCSASRSHAAWVTADETAEDPGQRRRDARPARAVPAARNAREEQADLEAQPGTDRGATTGRSTPRRCGRRSTTSTPPPMRPYFEAERVLQDGVFFAATQLYGITFTERTDIPAYHPDVRVFEVNERGRLPRRPVHARPLHARLEARRRVDELAHLAVASCSTTRSSSPTTSTCPSPPRASRRCSPTTRSTRSSTSSATRCTACSRG